MPDQWQVQVLAEMQVTHRIGVHCAGIDDGVLRSAGLEPVADVGERVRHALADAGPEARVCVLPEGPETIPFVAQTS